ASRCRPLRSLHAFPTRRSSDLIWAEHAWGRYWGWDPKEVWTFVIWVVYAGYLHARTTRGWAGARAAWLVVVAYVCVIINFTLVKDRKSTRLNSSHVKISYAVFC